MSWLKRLLGGTEEAAPLRGAPEVRREKTYSSETGYVYQYFYEGYREASRDSGEGIEFVFSVTADRKTRHPVSVFIGNESLAEWGRENSRELTHTEQYAIAKMGLFQAFDEQEELHRGGGDVRVAAGQVAEHCAALDL
jgi:hypothetical protein